MKKPITLYCNHFAAKDLIQNILKFTGSGIPQTSKVYNGWYCPESKLYTIKIGNTNFAFRNLEGAEGMFEYSFIDLDTIDLSEVMEYFGIKEEKNEELTHPLMRELDRIVIELLASEYDENVLKELAPVREKLRSALSEFRQVIQQILDEQ